jgi:polyhydroxybutyrate depolymerase
MRLPTIKISLCFCLSDGRFNPGELNMLFPWLSRFCSALVFLIFAAGPLVLPAALAQEPEQKITVGEEERTFVVHLPKGYSSNQKYPLVLVLHSTNQDANDISRLTRFDELADRDSVIVVYPNSLHGRWNLGVAEEEPQQPSRGMGRRGGYGRGGWPGGGGYPGGGRGGGYPGSPGSGSGGRRPQRQPPADDIAFFNDMLDKLSNEYSLDTTRVYATGLADGGFMDMRLGCVMADRITAIATVGAEMPKKLNCLPSRPISVLMINGTDDPIVKYNGGHYKGANSGSSSEGLATLSADDSAKYWAKLDNCSKKPEHSKMPAKEKGGLKTEVSTFAGCQQNAEIALYTIDGGGNTWPGGEQYMPEKEVGKTSNDLNANEVIWSFFVGRHLSSAPAPSHQATP